MSEKTTKRLKRLARMVGRPAAGFTKVWADTPAAERAGLGSKIDRELVRGRRARVRQEVTSDR
jgi:hypothetical protein